MSMNRTVIRCMSGALAVLSLSACNGIFEHIYDEPLPDNEFGFVAVDEKNGTGRIHIDATAYTEWHYIDLHDKRVSTVAVGDAAPEAWDFAIHRYDAKTSGGAVAECSVNDFGALADIGSLSEDAFVADEWTTDRITVDMSQMMDGTIVYAQDYCNSCLSRWLFFY